MLDDHHRVPQSTAKTSTSVEKPRRDHVVMVTTRIPYINESQLLATTGGTEVSCYRCTVPFGAVVLVAGVVVTAVAYAFNSHGSVISVLGLFLLCAGSVLLGSSALCWRLQLRKKKNKRRESQTPLVVGQGHCMV
uniref:Transmembrane protein 100 n=1 Tax=Tetraodon nigroviridis TaxID=99883 RepID=H3BZG4_TETNG